MSGSDISWAIRKSAPRPRPAAQPTASKHRRPEELKAFKALKIQKATQNVEIGVVWGIRSQPRSPAMSPFDRVHTASYSSLIETMCLFCTIFGRPYYRSSLWYSVSSVVCLSSVTFCIVAKRCVLAKKCLKE